MIDEVSLSPSNSMILLMDSLSNDIPKTFGGSIIVQTPTCIAVGCRSSHDGPTRFRLGDFADLQEESGTKYILNVNVPSGYISLCDVYGSTLFRKSVKSNYAKIIVYVNDNLEPDEVSFFVDEYDNE